METIRGSIDRFEEGYAVVYSDDGTKFDVLKSELPDVKAGTRLLLYLEGKNLVRIEVDEQGTKSAHDRIKSKYERLRTRKHLKSDD